MRLECASAQRKQSVTGGPQAARRRGRRRKTRKSGFKM